MRRIGIRVTTDEEREEEQRKLTMRVEIREKIQEALDLANLIESPDSTVADVKRGTAMALRGIARIARYLTT